MKKRILFILVIGVSFAPPVFAGSKSKSFLETPIEAAHTGESDRVGQGAAYCKYDEGMKIINQELSKSSESRTASAGK